MKNLNAQAILTLGLLIGISITGVAQHKVLHSNKRTILAIEGNVRQDWTITPRLNPDVLPLYDAVAKVKKVKFVSDIDSVEFTVKVNKPVDFIVLYKDDTAYTRISFTNQIPNTISMTDKLLSLSMFWSEARYNFAFYDQLTFDWDSLYKSYIPVMMQSKNDLDYSELMNKFIGSLQDAHSTFASVNYHYPYCDYLGMMVKYFDDTLRIVRVDSTLINIYPLGSKIVKINGLDANDYMDKYVNPYVVSRFKPTQQELAAYNLVSAKPLDNKITITCITPQGKIITNTPARDGKKSGHPFTGKEYDYDSELIHISWIKETNIAVLTINTFAYNQIIDYFERHKDTLYTADGIIIDIRNNGGGSTLIAKHFLNYIIKDSFYLTYGYDTRINNGVKRANGNYVKHNEDFYKMRAYQSFDPDTVYIEDSVKRFDCPIVILTSSNTVSAAEDFLIMLYERSDRPLFIGSPSFGSTGSPLVIWDWPVHDSYARVCTRRVRFPYSKKPFLEGITPDIWVKYSFEEYMSGIDKDMEVAVQELQKQIDAKQPK
ncbi:MAG: hypothetical protein LBL18_02170 [Bacteroidales bacterium]|jgi:hypothetical protein|nr:hypothetical protein [Bacteroidales bacterium]